MTRFTRRSTAGVASLLAVSAFIAVSANTVGALGSGRADSGTVYAAVTHTVGTTTYASGNSTDKLFGKGAVTYALHIVPNTPGTLKLTVPSVTYYYSNGSLTGTASATLTIGAGGGATVSNGKLSLTKGAGARKGHSFKGTFGGTGSVTTGAYKFTYTGKYK
jgi:hypothetical protein